MTNVFLKILSMSLTASYCIILICVIRLILKRAPKTFSYLLWSVAAIRLLCPLHVESMFSLVREPVITISNILISNDNELSLDAYMNFSGVSARNDITEGAVTEKLILKKQT